MNIIIYGTKKCQATRKLDRFLRERKFPFQFRDITEKPLTRNEVVAMLQGLGSEFLVDSGSTEYIKKGLGFLETTPIDLLCDNPSILRTPVIRLDKKYFDGSKPESLPL